jgi:hypothetical protein
MTENKPRIIGDGNLMTLGEMAWMHIGSDLHHHDIDDLICFYESEYQEFKNSLSRDALEYYKIVLYLKRHKILINHCK